MSEKKIAIFDIDKTIIKSDSMFDLLAYTKSKYPMSKSKLPMLVTKLILFKLGIINTKKAKEAMFYTFNYLNREELYDFYKNTLKKKLFNDAITKMKDLKSKGYFVLLVSASPEAYLKYFEEEEYVDFVIGTKFENLDDRFTNIMQGTNCKGNEKVKRIKEFLKENNFTINKELSFAFSDSLSDKPMFDLVKKAYLINYKKKNNDFEILNWS
ncbi:MAG: HAD-IB family hydrolase [Sarcina sp.]